MQCSLVHGLPFTQTPETFTDETLPGVDGAPIYLHPPLPPETYTKFNYRHKLLL